MPIPFESQYVFENEEMKGRIVQVADNYFLLEWKPNLPEAQWTWWFVGTAEFFQFTDDERRYAIDKRK